MSRESSFDIAMSALAERLAEEVAGRVARIIREAATPPPLPILLTTQDAARLLGLGEQTLRNLRSSGEGPRAVTRGKLVRYRREHLVEWAADEFA
jgi:excisionase family DNA binding protein